MVKTGTWKYLQRKTVVHIQWYLIIINFFNFAFCGGFFLSLRFKDYKNRQADKSLHSVYRCCAAVLTEPDFFKLMQEVE